MSYKLNNRFETSRSPYHAIATIHENNKRVISLNFNEENEEVNLFNKILKKKKKIIMKELIL